MDSVYMTLLLSFCAVSLASPILTTKGGESRENTTDSEEAKVEEIPQPAMTVQNGQQYDYRLPGFYTFNNGEPFFVEKDPLTGAIDFNKKTTSTAPDKPLNQRETDFTSESKKDRVKEGDEDNDYLYDEEFQPDQQFTEEQIDRKDSITTSNNYRPNDILKNPYKVSPDLHQFLNLPVHYSSSDKFPLISSSYANTKIQGTGSSSYSNHKYVTSSTQSPPSYYTFRQTTTTEKPTSTTRWTTTKATTTTTTEIPEEEYENTDDLSYTDYDIDEQFENQPSEMLTTRPSVTSTTTTASYPITTYRPTTTTTVTPTPTVTTEGKQTQRVSIVTSLPLDIYYSTQETSSALPTTSTTTVPSTTTETAKIKDILSTTSTIPQVSSTTERYTTPQQNQYYRPNEQFYHVVDEPFRPIFGPGGRPAQSHLINKPEPDANNLNEFEEISQTEPHYNNSDSRVPGFQKLPEDQSTAFSQHPSEPPKIIGIELPRPDPPKNFYSDQPIKLVPGQHATVTFLEPQKSNTITRPIQDQTFQSPQNSGKPQFPPYHVPTSHVSPQKQSPTFTRTDNVRPNYQGNNPNNEEPLLSNEPKPDEVIYPQQRPTGVIPPKYASKPIPPTIIDVIPPKLQQGQFKQPSKVQNHFIKVSPDQENPSYSLQTSFSIGVPPANSGKNEEQNIRPGQGIGQVLFPDDNPEPNLQPEVIGNAPPPRLRPPIQMYQPNRPGVRQPIHAEPPIGGLRPPIQGDNYPRPHWETHSKPIFYNGQPQNALPKHDVVLPPHYPGLNRVKPDASIAGHDLPNILPQFRPNAKVGQGDYHAHLSPPIERPREPLDTLQPPPLPRPQHLRINRNDEDSEIDEEIKLFNEKTSTPFPIVHHRTGPQANVRVTTLQMMQQIPPRRTILRPEYPNAPKNTTPEKDRPVFLVYPSSNFPKKHQPSEGGVVIGIRGSQRPLPPSNLEKDDLDTFPLDDNKNFPIPGRDRVDTPILKTKSTPKPVIKHDFPYTIIRPDEKNVPEERILSGNSGTKEYTAFSPTAIPNKDEMKDHDSEINIIPYLQDYMPFAMKKLSTTLKPVINKENKLSKPLQENQPISVTLNTNLATTTPKPNPTSEYKILERKPPSYHESDIKGSGESEFTVSAVMHTHQQRPPNHRPIETTVNEAPSQPKPIDLEAPFQASLSAPESHGWSVVRPSSEQLSNGNDRIDESDTEVFSKKNDEDSKFDIENFKPQLFGGFKPIIPPLTDKSGSSSDSSNNRDKHGLNVFIDERQEKKL